MKKIIIILNASYLFFPFNIRIKEVKIKVKEVESFHISKDEKELDILVNKIMKYKLPPMKAIMVGTELFWDSRNREGEYLKEEISKELNIETIKLYETNEYEKDK